MATGPTLTPAPKNMETDFYCGICHNGYKQPKMLDCTHSFCEHCLRKYQEGQYRNAKILCPVCRQETVPPKTGIPGLKTNFHLISIAKKAALLETVQIAASSSKTKLLCEICDSSRATHRCLECRHSICFNCRKAHLRFPATSSGHSVPALKDVRKGLVTAKKAQDQDALKCQKHNGEVHCFYCETCQELICKDCTVLDHRDPQHHYIDYEKASAKYRQSINDKISHLEIDIGVLETCLADTANDKLVFNGNVSEARRAVQEKAAKVIAKVKAEEQRLLEEIDTHERDHKNMMDEHETAVNKILQRKQHSLETATDVTTTASDSDFLSVYPVINKALDMHSSQHPPKVSGMRPRPLILQQKECDIHLGKLLVEDTWELCRLFGKRGSGPGEFGVARGITASQDDEIAVADCNNKRIVVHNSQGEAKSSILTNANGIAATSNQWVAANPGVVKVFNKDKTLAHEFRTVPQSEVGKTEVLLASVAIKKNGNIIVGDIKRKVLTEHDPTDGSLMRTMPVEISPFYLAAMNNDRIAVSGGGQGQVNIVDDNGTTIFTIKPTIIGKPVEYCEGLCCSSSGIYIAIDTSSTDTGHIHHYDSSGTFLSCIIQDLYNPQGITFTADGQQLAVADYHSVKIYHKA